MIIILTIHTSSVLVTSATDLCKELMYLVTFTPATLNIAIVPIPVIIKIPRKAEEANYAKYNEGDSNVGVVP